MASYTDFHGVRQRNEEWTAFPQGKPSLTLPYYLRVCLR